MAKRAFKILRCEHLNIFKVFFAIFSTLCIEGLNSMEVFGYMLKQTDIRDLWTIFINPRHSTISKFTEQKFLKFYLFLGDLLRNQYV